MSPLLKPALLGVSLLLIGASAGLFLAWQISVIPGLRGLSAKPYLEFMQSANRAILNPTFFLVFLGSAFALILAALVLPDDQPTAILLWSAVFVYGFGTVAVTVFGNVPLNETLDALSLSDFSAAELTRFRESYAPAWGRFHMLRTCCAMIAFALTVAAALWKGI